jgi:hypothetical protein
MPSSPNRGFSPYLKPLSWRANPDEETTDWRAVRGRTAHTVRRAGRALALPDPYPPSNLDPLALARSFQRWAWLHIAVLVLAAVWALVLWQHTAGAA